jgi:hypothetical protein
MLHISILRKSSLKTGEMPIDETLVENKSVADAVYIVSNSARASTLV